MVIFQAIISWISNSLGDLINTAFAWATLLLFGKVPAQRARYLSLLSLLSFVWFGTLIGIILPDLLSFLLTTFKLPDWISPALVRTVCLILALILPFANGFVSEFLHYPDERPQSFRGWMHSALNGWRLTVGLALTLALMVFIAPINRLGEVLKKWTSEHIPVVIDPNDYGDVVDELDRMLQSARCIKARREQPAKLMQVPMHLLSLLSGNTLQSLVGQKLVKLTYKDGELEIRPTDLIVRGTEQQVNCVLSAIVSDYSFGKAHLTWTREANEVENDLRAVFLQLKQGKIGRRTILHKANMAYDKLTKLALERSEWETLFRMYLKLKVDCHEDVPDAEKKAS